MKSYQFKFWHYGLLLTLIVGAYASYNLTADDKSLFITGEPTHGHHQIELACTSCHTDGFAGEESIQQSCLNCHAEELELADDSHPRKKFLDPRNAQLLETLDARQCISCHTEHKQQITREMGVSLAGDFCFHCHSEIAEERSSHQGMGFETCASAGCHNYHDNGTLYEDFLIAHVGQPDLLEDAKLPARTAMQSWLQEHPNSKPLKLQQADIHEETATAEIAAAWAQSPHAQAEVNCSSCHADGQMQFTSAEVVEQCASCHSDQRESFTQGKHGMRLSSKLPQEFVQQVGAMTPNQAWIPMQSDASGELSCTSCHSPHDVDLQFAAVEACLSCHSDEHSLAYKESPHFDTWQANSDNGVSCASCHLPRETHGEQVVVNHNQNHNLRPNEKMLPVCLNCHGAEFSLAALADKKLISQNFKHKPADKHETFDLIRDRIARISNSKKNETKSQ
ncbi:ammonia-forming cytochrome c nitrite reductase subunit c552 [Microbulbifer sp. THAF38]|uniref:ammonia-forming cytochrome c nitrite reductase subunit c552 n=1 Tax=Microbulbifer sp. THAF38 TaxID=2587856 RepID=UPI001268BDE1|nr:ammonia-forming cytochrome c nitrite reductase subunit c552 [Microbulbifer sp. THAF38]QFT55919.1 Doubled CXXCH motif protein [Microbulbifer sp. THAF38]